MTYDPTGSHESDMRMLGTDHSLLDMADGALQLATASINKKKM